MSSGRWHTAQFLKRIGATSLVNVICLLAGSLLFALMVCSANRQSDAKTKIAVANRSLLTVSTSYFSIWRFNYLKSMVRVFALCQENSDLLARVLYFLFLRRRS